MFRFDNTTSTLTQITKHTGFPEAQPSPRHPGRGTLTPLLKDYFLAPRGIDPRSVHTVADARAAIATAIRQQGPALGCDFSELSESQLNDDVHYNTWMQYLQSPAQAQAADS